jgi:hypothetical protein
VCTAIREEGGRITGIDPELADRSGPRTPTPVEAARNGKRPSAGPQLRPPAPLARPDRAGRAEPTGDQGNFLAARVKEAELRGELLELDKLERIGSCCRARWCSASSRRSSRS